MTDQCFGPREAGLEEFSVVFTDRALNHMSAEFQEVMRDISEGMREVYRGEAVALVPGGGSYAMEAVARAFAAGREVLVIRNGWFSYRWSQIFEATGLPASETVLKARRVANDRQAPFVPASLDEILSAIDRQRPAVLFAPHVETASGMILPDEWLAAIGRAMRDVGGLFVLDCIASGAVWVDMAAAGVDVLISAPQKGWSSTPSAGIVVMNERAEKALEIAAASSFAGDLGRWRAIMKAYEDGAHAYHATMPTDALRHFRDNMKATFAFGLEAARKAQWALGNRVRAALAARGVRSVAAEGFAAPGVVVSHTDDPEIRSGRKFATEGVQIAAGVPLACDEGDDFSSFRIGLFGLDKLADVDGKVARLEAVFDKVIGPVT